MILNQIKLGKKFNDEYTLTLKLYVCENNEIFISKEDEIIYNVTDNVLIHNNNIINRYEGNLYIFGNKIVYRFYNDIFSASIENVDMEFINKKIVMTNIKEVIKEIPVEVIKEVPVEVIKEVPKEVIKEVKVEVPVEKNKLVKSTGILTGKEFTIPNYKPSTGKLVLKLNGVSNISNYTVNGSGKVTILSEIKETDKIHYEVTKVQ